MNSLTQSSLFQLTAARIRLFFRESEAVFWIFAFPMLLAAGLSIAFRNRPADVLPVAGTTTQITQAFNADRGLKAITLDVPAGHNALATGQILLLAIQQSGSIRFLYDDTNPDARAARLIADRAIQKAAGQRESVQIRNELNHDTGSRYIDFVIPGLLGMTMMSSGIWAIGFWIVEARQNKLLKRLIASPMPRWQYLASFVFWRLLLLPAEVGAFLGFSYFAFGVPARGSFWDLTFLCLLISLTFSAMGLLIASRAKTMQAASGLINLTMLPMWILSGIFFSASRFPHIVQPFIRALPLTAAIDALRANMLQGTPLAYLLFPVTVLLAWMVVTFSLSLWTFRWR
jgi:ABC-type multidrug transport system permease subunit